MIKERLYEQKLIGLCHGFEVGVNCSVNVPTLLAKSILWEMGLAKALLLLAQWNETALCIILWRGLSLHFRLRQQRPLVYETLESIKSSLLP